MKLLPCVPLLALLLSSAGVLESSRAEGADMPPKPLVTKKEEGKAPWQRMLTGEDAKRVVELSRKTVKLFEAEKYVEALTAAREVLALRLRVQGPDHWESVDAWWEAETIRKAAEIPVGDRQIVATLAQRLEEAGRMYHQGRHVQALVFLEEALNLQSKLLGEEHPDRARTWTNMAASLDRQRKHAEAQALLQKALQHRLRFLGEYHPNTVKNYSDLGSILLMQKKYNEAQKLLEKALEIQQWLQHESHPTTATLYQLLARSLHAQEKTAEARPLFQRALDLRRKWLGEEHLPTADSYHDLAVNLMAQGRDVEAQRLGERALDLHRRLLGEHNLKTIIGYNTLAVSLNGQCRFAEAEYLLRRVLELDLRLLDENRPERAVTYGNLALNLHGQGKYAEAQLLFEKALDLHRKLSGASHPWTLGAAADLASNLIAQRKPAEAQSLLLKALEQFDSQASAGNLAALARTYQTLAVNYHTQGKYAEAHPLFQKALDLRRQWLGEHNPLTAQVSHNLAANLYHLGKYAEAEELDRQTLEARRKWLGDDHPRTADGYTNLARTLYGQGKYIEAEQMWTRAVERSARSQVLFAFAGLDRATVTAQRSPLPTLAAVLARNGKPADAWRRLEEGLGRGLFDDLSARQVRGLTEDERRRQQELLATLQRLDKLFANLPSAKDGSREQQKQLTDLSRQHIATQAEYSQFEAELVRKYGVAAGDVYDLARIQVQLPADAALLAWVDIAGQPHDQDPNGEHWVCVVRHQGTPTWVKLPGSGPGGTWTKEDDELPARVAQSFVQRSDAAEAGWQKQAAALARQRLAPVAPLLAGADKLPPVKRLIVLPSPAMASVPIEALLTERDNYTISYAPSGTLFAWLREKAPGGAPRPLSLLALADPAFTQVAVKPVPAPAHGIVVAVVIPNTPAAKAGLRSGDVLLSYADTRLTGVADLAPLVQRQEAAGIKEVVVQIWREGQTHGLTVATGKLGIQLDKRPAAEVIRSNQEFARLMKATRSSAVHDLPGTRREAQAIAQTFQAANPKARILTLFGSDASEQRLAELAAAGELVQYRYLHLATHGRTDHHRVLQSALVLADDRLPDPVAQVLAGQPVYDGRLTAEQILRTWKLDADLVVLSACESALGQAGGGEGFVGFSQALFLAGARTAVLSLWRVDDTATALLMRRFYENLLGQRAGLKRPLSKAEALREAQRWLRTLTVEQVKELHAQLPPEMQRVEKVKGPPQNTARAARSYDHPYYWAAFILLGDPE